MAPRRETACVPDTRPGTLPGTLPDTQSTIARIGHSEHTAKSHHQGAQPYPSNQHLVLDANAPGTVRKLGAKRDVEVPHKPGGNSGFGHHLLACAVATLFRIQAHAAVRNELGLLRDVVRSFNSPHRREAIGDAIQIHAIADSHPGVDLTGEFAGRANAYQGHGETDVRNHHPQVSAGRAVATAP